jgi:glycosyltransferase involved in cell wall biosynthesis
VPEESLSCTVVIPARNEKGNIENAVRRIPEMGKHTEIVFVEGNSADGTAEEIERVIAAHPERDVRLIRQGSGVGKGDAVRKGFAAAAGDVLMILDADLTGRPRICRSSSRRSRRGAASSSMAPDSSTPWRSRRCEY